MRPQPLRTAYSALIASENAVLRPNATSAAVCRLGVPKGPPACALKDGTSAFYGTAPTLGLVGADTNASTPEGYVAKMTAAWGSDAEVIMQRYPLTERVGHVWGHWVFRGV